jgi:hypothetical protein
MVVGLFFGVSMFKLPLALLGGQHTYYTRTGKKLRAVVVVEGACIITD